MDIVCHVALADDWEMSERFGEYEVAKRGVPLEPGGFIRAVDPEDVDRVVRECFDGIASPLLRIDCSTEGLIANGVPVTRVDGRPRIYGPIPMAPEVVTGVTLLQRTN